MMQPTAEDRAVVLAQYRQLREQIGATPYQTMLGLRQTYSGICMMALLSVIPPPQDAARKWRAADEYVQSMGGRTRFWFLPPYIRP